MALLPHKGSTEQKYVNEALVTNLSAPSGPYVDGFERHLAYYNNIEVAIREPISFPMYFFKNNFLQLTRIKN